MGILLSLFLFISGIAALVVATQYLLRSAGHIGMAIGVSPFIVGVCIVAFGTSLPEATVALFSTFNGLVEVPVAQTVGSNIANILLVLGVAAIIARRLVISKNLVDVELSLFVAVLLLFVFVVFDGKVLFYEGIFLVIAFFLYLAYIFKFEDNRTYPTTTEEQLGRFSRLPREIGWFIGSVLLIAVAAQVTIFSVESLAVAFSISEWFVAVTVLALGTSLPELFVSVQAALRKEVEVAIGNVIGSNVFNILFAVGVPALFSTLTVSSSILSFGIPALVSVTALFVISSLSNRIYIWEGLFYVLLYFLLIGSLFAML